MFVVYSPPSSRQGEPGAGDEQFFKGEQTMQFEKGERTAKTCHADVFGLRARFFVVLVVAMMSLTLPAAVLAQRPARAGARAAKAAKALAVEGDSIRPFRVRVPQQALDDLRRRIAATQWPEQETASDGSQGVRLATMRELARYWETSYDWRKVEARLNALPQFVTNIDGLDIHFIHVRSKEKNALPLIVTHGWPGSIIEQLKIIDPLTNPTAHGGSAADAFDIVIPSLPDIADWEAFEAARQNLMPKLSLRTPAPRYGVPAAKAVGGS
jgi:hypothetical protein